MKKIGVDIECRRGLVFSHLITEKKTLGLALPHAL